ncbi:MAG: hypothetical protein AB1627_08075 [Chloroflexota bacterium]
MNTTRTRARAGRMVAAALALVAAVAACSTADAGAPTASPAPSAPPVATPVPSPIATPAPSPSAPGVPDVDLDVADGHDVVVVISDRNELLAGARSGKGKDGMSVRWGEAQVRNLDANTIEVTWSAYAKDQTLSLVVIPTSDGVLLRFGQEMPYPNTDAMGADRVLILEFVEAVSADQVVAEFTTADD